MAEKRRVFLEVCLRAWPMLGVAAGAAFLPGTAAAQSTPEIGRTFSVPTRKIDITATGETLYDSNVIRGRSDTANRRNLEKEDVKLSPAVNLDISMPAGNGNITLSGIAGYDFYVRNSQLNRERLDLSTSASLTVRPCGLDVDAGYARQQTDLVDLSIIPGEADDSIVNVQSIRQVGATVSCGATVGIRPTASVRYLKSSNSAEQRDIQNFNSWTYTAGLEYSSPAFGILTVFGSRSKFTYADRDFEGVLIGSPDFRVKSAGVLLDRRLGARLQVRAQVSYANVSLPAGFDDDQGDGVNWDVSASLRVGTRMLLSAGTGRAIDSSLGFNSNFARSTSYTANVEYALSSLLRLSMYESYRKRDFQVSVLQPELLLTQDVLNEAGARLSYQRRRYNVTLRTSYQKRTADIDEYEYDSWRVALGLGIKLGR
jgi:hypothetical protein